MNNIKQPHLRNCFSIAPHPTVTVNDNAKKTERQKGFSGDVSVFFFLSAEPNKSSSRKPMFAITWNPCSFFSSVFFTLFCSVSLLLFFFFFFFLLVNVFCSVCLKLKCPLCYVTHCEHEALNILTGFLTDNRDTLFFFKQKKRDSVWWIGRKYQFSSIFWTGFRVESEIRFIVSLTLSKFVWLLSFPFSAAWIAFAMRCSAEIFKGNAVSEKWEHHADAEQDCKDLRCECNLHHQR